MLTAPVFQSLSVSKNPDSLTKPKFQVPAVSKKPDLLTVGCLAVLFGTYATPADRAAHIDLADCIIQFLTNDK